MKNKFLLKIFMCVVILTNIIPHFGSSTYTEKAEAAYGIPQLIYEYTGKGTWSTSVQVGRLRGDELAVVNSSGYLFIPKDRFTTGNTGSTTSYNMAVGSGGYSSKMISLESGFVPFISLINTNYTVSGIWDLKGMKEHLWSYSQDVDFNGANDLGNHVFTDEYGTFVKPSIKSKDWTTKYQLFSSVDQYPVMLAPNSSRLFYQRYTPVFMPGSSYEIPAYFTIASINLNGSASLSYYRRNIIPQGEFVKRGFFLYSVRQMPNQTYDGNLYIQPTMSSTQTNTLFIQGGDYRLYDMTDDYAYFVKSIRNTTDGKNYNYPYRKHYSNLYPEEQLINTPITSLTAERNDRAYYYTTVAEPTKVYKMDLNHDPNITLTSPLTQTVAAVTGLNTFRVEGFVQDADNDTLTVTAEVKGVSRTITLENTSVDKPFTFNFDAIADNLPTGTHIITVTAKDQFGGISTKTLSLTVKVRASNNMIITLDDTIYYETIYSDPEADLQKSERWRYVHNQSYYENPIGTIPDNILWRDAPYNIFPKTGHYLITLQGMDTKKFEEYQLWSQDSLDQLNIYVHRKPVPRFTITVYSNGSGGFPTVIEDTSYDLDKQSLSNGIAESEWSWKDSAATTWTSGVPTINLTVDHTYEVKLRVKDHQGAWSDPLIKAFTTTGGAPILLNSPPVATMTIPSGTQAIPTVFTTQKPTLSWNQTDPDAATVFTSFEIQVTNEANTATIFSSGTIAQNTATTTKSWTTTSDLPTGEKLRVRVRVNDGLVWSAWSAQTWMIINRPPVAKFDWSPKPVWEGDTVILTNQSSDPDGDPLTYNWNITGPENYQQTATTINITRRPLHPGDYIVKLTASDGHVQTTATRTIRVEPLLLEANVSYTDLWLEHHLMMGHETVNNPKSFYTGEIFIVSAVGSLAATNGVTASLDALGKDGHQIAIAVQLTSTNPVNHFSGHLYDPILSSLTGGLPEGQYQINFKIEYVNGIIKEVSIPIQIIGHVQGAVNVHRKQ